MLPGERRIHFDALTLHLQRVVIAAVSRMRRTRRNIFGCIHAANVEGCSHFAERVIRFRMLRQRNHHAIFAQNTGLFSGNGSDSEPKPLRVIE